MSKIIDALQQVANVSGDSPALQGQSMTLSYSDLLNAVARVAAQLNILGLERLGLAADNGPEWIIVDLACQLAGIP